MGAAVFAAMVGSASCEEPVSLEADVESRLASAVCESDCGCRGSSCGGWARQEARRIGELVEQFELTFDEDCFAKRLQAHEDYDCQPPTSAQHWQCGAPCQLAFGTRAVGERCTAGQSFSSCQRGLICLDETCADPCDRSAAGQPCSDGSCPYPTLCDSTTNVCQARRLAGESCDGSAPCEGGLFCNGGVCRGLGEFGDPCSGHDQCLSGNCPAAFCETRPAEGEACTGQIRCAAGLSCEDDVCVEATQPGGLCPCPQGQWCDNGTCRYADVASCGATFLVQ